MSEIRIYALEGCPHSKKAVDLVRSSCFEFTIIRVCRSEKEQWKVVNKHPTFPQVFVGTTLIGGCDDLCKWLDSHSCKVIADSI